MRNVYIIGAYSTQIKKYPEFTVRDLARQGYLGVLKDAGMDNGDDIGMSYFSNAFMHHWGQTVMRGQVCFIPLVREGLFPERVAMVNVEGACATGSLGFQGACKDVMAGVCEVALAIGVEKLYFPHDRDLQFKVFEEGIDRFNPEDTVEAYQKAAQVCGREFKPGPDRSMFMDTYAIQANYHMWRHSTTQRQIAIGCAKNHNFGALNPKAQYQFPLTVEQVLEDREVSYPLTRSMCAPIGDGAAATVVCSEEYLKNLPSNVQRRAVKVKGFGLSGGKYRDVDEPSMTKIAADRAYKMAGVGPQDIDLAEVHDATSFSEIYQAEMMGFCPIGEGGKLVESGATMLGGTIPINTSGGLVSKGHAIGATGLSMIYELATQLRGEAGPRQVKDAEFALAENGGGVIGLEEAVCSVVILQKDPS